MGKSSLLDVSKNKVDGTNSSKSIIESVSYFWEVVKYMNLDQGEMIENARRSIPNIDRLRLEQIRDIAERAKLMFESVLCYNLYHSQVLPEGCTVFFATGKATESGRTIFAKNSDKGGDEGLIGENSFMNREINVVSYFENEDGSHVIGVSAAGTTGIKMGLNSHGVAAGTNYGNTIETKRRTLTSKDIFASDRAQIARDALRESTALKAAQYAVSKLIDVPMNTSGILEFADGNGVYIVESSYDMLAVIRVVDKADSRSNNFVELSQLNQPGDVTSFSRYHRTQDLLREKCGHLTVQDMKVISMDHNNGTGSLGICRHSEGLDSATLASSVIEIDDKNPEKSIIHIALGKPCNAWRNPDGNITISMDCKKDKIPEEFLNGEVFKKYCYSAPIEG